MDAVRKDKKSLYKFMTALDDWVSNEKRNNLDVSLLRFIMNLNELLLHDIELLESVGMFGVVDVSDQVEYLPRIDRVLHVFVPETQLLRHFNQLTHISSLVFGRSLGFVLYRVGATLSKRSLPIFNLKIAKLVEKMNKG